MLVGRYSCRRLFPPARHISPHPPSGPPPCGGAPSSELGALRGPAETATLAAARAPFAPRPDPGSSSSNSPPRRSSRNPRSPLSPPSHALAPTTGPCLDVVIRDGAWYLGAATLVVGGRLWYLCRVCEAGSADRVVVWREENW